MLTGLRLVSVVAQGASPAALSKNNVSRLRRRQRLLLPPVDDEVASKACLRLDGAYGCRLGVVQKVAPVATCPGCLAPDSEKEGLLYWPHSPCCSPHYSSVIPFLTALDSTRFLVSSAVLATLFSRHKLR